MDNGIKYGIGGLLIGLIVGMLVAPAFRGDAKRVVTAVGSDGIDKHFIEQMIPHHEGAIEMAKVALAKSRRPEVISLANDIIEAQTKEISDMKSWYQAWFGTQVPVTSQHNMGNSHMMGGSMVHMGGMSGDMELLEKAQDFDLEFVRQMISHHEMAVMMAQMLAASTERSEMKQLANNVITSQTKEIEMMRSWAEAWSR